MNKVNELVRAFIDEARINYEAASNGFDEILNNPEHTQSAMIQAAAKFNEAKGAYSAAMNVWLKLFEAGAI